MSESTSLVRTIDGAIARFVQGVSSGWNAAAEVDRFRTVRVKTLSILDETTAAIASRAELGKWSVLQIADHLLRSEEMYREQFRRLIAKGAPIDISLAEVDVGFPGVPAGLLRTFETPMKMFNRFVPHMVREAIVRFPLMAALNPQASAPREGLTLRKLREDLETSFAQTEMFFETPLPANFEQLTINHPLLGNNTIPQLFSILMAHEQRHHGQMSETLLRATSAKTSLEPVNIAQWAEPE